MSGSLVLLHTITSLAELFDDLCKEIMGGEIGVRHIVDEATLSLVLEHGGLIPYIYQRVGEHAVAAERSGADVFMMTCSSISPCAEVASAVVGIPVLRVDRPMVDKAIELGNRIGVAATASTTLKPTSDLVRARAAALGRDVVVDAVLCEGAYDALFAGDVEAHDRIVRETLEDLMARTEVVVLAQASMARVATSIPDEERAAPVLSSPRLAVERARDVLLDAVA